MSVSKYLYLNGVNSKFITPSITWNKIVFECLITTNDGSAQRRLMATSINDIYMNIQNGYKLTQYGFQSITVNGNPMDSNADMIGRKLTIQGTLTTSQNVQVRIGVSRFDNLYLELNLYDLKLYNNDVLVAHYNISAGSVNDVTGNNNHATLTGGTTWYDLNSTSPSISFPTLQRIYEDVSYDFSTTQEFYGSVTPIEPEPIAHLKVNGLTIPIYDISSNYNATLRVNTSNGKGYFKLTSLEDVNASSLRIKTPSGIKAISI